MKSTMDHFKFFILVCFWLARAQATTICGSVMLLISNKTSEWSSFDIMNYHVSTTKRSIYLYSANSENSSDQQQQSLNEFTAFQETQTQADGTFCFQASAGLYSVKAEILFDEAAFGVELAYDNDNQDGKNVLLSDVPVQDFNLY